LQSAVLEAVETAQNVANRRNDIVYQDWVLRGPDAMRPVADLPEPTSSSERELFKYVDEWRREPKDSRDWLRQPSKSLELVRAQALPELIRIERALAAATDRVMELVLKVASARDTGHPSGWSAAIPDEFSEDPPDPQPLGS